jgi:hypothetical protein
MSWAPDLTLGKGVKVALTLIIMIGLVAYWVSSADWTPYLVSLNISLITRHGLEPLNTTQVTLSGYDLFAIHNSKTPFAFRYIFNQTSDMQIQYWIQVSGNDTYIVAQQSNDSLVPKGYFGIVLIQSPEPYLVVFHAVKP